MTDRIRTRALILALSAATVCTGAWAQDGGTPPKTDETTDAEPAEAESAETGTTGAESTDADAPSAPVFSLAASLDEARQTAKASGSPLLVIAVPDWYESPAWERLDEGVIQDAETGKPLEAFVGALVRETRDREIHVRHRVPFKGYPLVVVLDAKGAYLGHTSGAPLSGDEAGWAERIAAIPPRAAKIADLRARLEAASENPALLFDLGVLLSQAGEHDRADSVFERMEAADPLGPADRIGEARYLVMRHRVIGLMEGRKFADVEPLALRWRRRFSDHARIADVLLLQANARFLAGKADEARELWQALVDDHPKTDAAKTAKEALDKLAD